MLSSMLALAGLLPTTLSGVLALLIVLVVLWVLISIPVYIAGKIATGGKASYPQAMSATLGGGLGYFIVLYGADFLLGMVLGSSGVVLAFILALILWLAVYRASFETGWIHALGIVAVAWVVLFILNLVLEQTFGVAIPKFYPF